MNDLETKQLIVKSLQAFATKPPAEAALALFESLGYKSQKRLTLKPNTAATFVAQFAKDKPLNPETALLADWQTVDFLFQLTDDEVRATAGGNQPLLFESKGKYNGAAMESYLFLAIALKKPQYTRTELSGITRAVNRLFPMPALLLFRHGDTLTLAVINRRLHKREESKDVLEKVTLIKDIRFANPHRAHVEILFDLSFDLLREANDFSNFVTLHAAWQKTLDSSELNKRFFLEIANWYFWALNHIQFPKDAPKESDGHDHISVIRLITRLIFCWFVKEKGLIPDALFDQRKLAQTLNGFAPDKSSDKDSVFYRAILQNLFFATLNTEMDKRAWTKEEQNFMAHSLYRFRESFRDAGTALDLFKNIPFLNGGLFECLDKDLGEKASPRYLRVDGFSRRPDSQPTVPDFLFFGPERDVDLSAEYGDTRFKRVTVRGLIHTFQHYKFTITENTPIEEEIALDPELSGKVFENLLAAYNPETGATARKQTGSFFTPREIVNYMVDEALIAYLRTKLQAAHPSAKDVEARLRHLFAYNAEKHQFTPQEVDTLIAAIDNLKSLDPAVGSAAFPMGILHKLVFILGKLDPRNEKWKERQVNRVREAMAAAEKIEDATIRERTLRELEQQIAGINEAFEHNELDYGRKLYLIENCIYGVDIQPIAVQIAKMRFFISLIVDQKIDDTQPNRGVRPLPNLETKFVAANTLIGVSRPGQQMLRNRDIDAKEAELRRVRERHFMARTPASKAKCRDQDAKLRAEIAELFKGDGWDIATARKLAAWDPYDQNTSASFFDPEWMFGTAEGFAITLGNPPYLSAVTMARDAETKEQFKHLYPEASGAYDIYILFLLRGVQLIDSTGTYCWIIPNRFLIADYAKKTKATLLDNFGLLWSVDVSTFQVFDETGVYPIIIMGRAGQKGEFSELVINSYEDLERRKFERRTSLKAYSTFRDCGVEVGSGATGFQAMQLKALVSEKQTRSAIPFVVSGNVDRYYFSNENVRYMGDRYRFAFVERGQAIADSKWSMWKKPKIIVAGMTREVEAVFSPNPVGLGVGVYAIYGFGGYDPLCLTGILNSKFMTYYFRERFKDKHLAGGYLAINKSTIEEMPLVKIDARAQRKISDTAHEILAAKRKHPDADTAALERDIDLQVYTIYGLTPEEIEAVEQAAH